MGATRLTDEGLDDSADDPPQGEVIEKILRHCGLWRASAPRPPPDVDGLVHDLASGSPESQSASSGQVGELTYVDMDTFPASFASPLPPGSISPVGENQTSYPSVLSVKIKFPILYP